MSSGKILLLCGLTAITILLGACSDNSKPSRAVNSTDTSGIDSSEPKLPGYLTDSMRYVDNYNIDVHDSEMAGIINQLQKSGPAATKDMSQCWGDCDGSYRNWTSADSRLTLHIFKRDCGDYGFGNEQYLLKNDSLYSVRVFNISLTNDTTGHVFLSEERIYDFRGTLAESKERSRRFTNPDGEHRLDNIKFSQFQYNRDSLAGEFRKQLSESLDLAKSSCE